MILKNYLKKLYFSRFHNNVMLIFTNLWTKNDFLKNDLKNRALPRNVDIYEDMYRKPIFQNNLKKLFSSKF